MYIVDSVCTQEEIMFSLFKFKGNLSRCTILLAISFSNFPIFSYEGISRFTSILLLGCV